MGHEEMRQLIKRMAHAIENVLEGAVLDDGIVSVSALHRLDELYEQDIRPLGASRMPISDPAMMTEEQLNELGELADEIDNLVGATQLPMPPAFHLQQLQRALPELSKKIKALTVAIGGADPWQE